MNLKTQITLYWAIALIIPLILLFTGNLHGSGAGWWILFAAVIFGIGVIIQLIRNKRNSQ